MSTVRSRIQKGRSFQKKVMGLFIAAFGLSSDDIRTPVGSENGPDLVLCNEEARRRVGLAVECKNQKSISIWEALEQTKKHSTESGLTPALIFHRSQQNNTDIWITVPIQHYLQLRKDLS